ncbi:coiled-coil domain-containing protein [Deinococcus radiodurans]|jgi:hypothetical protein|uniref:hypothetical protein n=2 Tax=Deinococcus radiodurans TaxID=1299 RepID=UPI0002EC771E|nr:hypothetical protein [Deinococcus radiodurans]ANC71683.1 hypothetical protein A2G07_07810 [Deinococcus radiodurans R1 = ATCC 13939 = DSM 20539]QIP32080.1 hypothetical protein HAV35_08155 [Deinococcus radiodurans]UID70136.1 hypothetical protein DRO_1139 [Deinococcus radiodurans R1 = ATCC 13939 = DSM 20539]
MSVKRPADSATKAKILEAFDDLIQEYSQLEGQLGALKGQLAQKDKEVREAQKQVAQQQVVQQQAAPKGPMQEASRELPTEPGEASGRMTVALGLLAQLQAGASGTLAELSEQLSAEAAGLQGVLKLAQTEREALRDLYGLTAGEHALRDLLAEYDAAAEASRTELETQQTATAEEWEARQREWEDEEDARERATAERDLAARTARERDTADYSYQRDLDRRLDDETYRTEQAELTRARAERLDAQEREWNSLEAELTKREQKWREVTERAAALPAEREAALKRAEAEGNGIGTRQARVRTELQEKDIEGQRRVYEQRIQSAQTRLDLLSVRAQQLSEQVSAASRQMQDLAVKAIEGQANASSLSAFKELAMEQAKAQGKGKN